MAEGKSGASAREIETVVTPVFRVSFCDTIFKADKFSEDPDDVDKKPTFGLTGIWTPEDFMNPDPKSPEFEFLQSEKDKWLAMAALADKVSFAFHQKKVKDFPPNFKKPMRDGVEKEHLDGYGAGKKFAAMTTTRKPGVVDRNKKPITDQEQFYAGCYARALVHAYPYAHKKGGKGVSFGLINVQKVRDGEPFGASRIAPEDSFEDDLGPEEDNAITGSDPF